MKEPTVVHSTFVIERTYPASAKRVFSAFADRAKKLRWFVEGEGFVIDDFKMDFRVGGLESSHFRYKDGPTISFDATYQDIIPDRRIVNVYSMTVGDKRISSSLVTIVLIPMENETKLIFTEQGAYFDGTEDVKGREEGCRAQLEELAKELQNHE